MNVGRLLSAVFENSQCRLSRLGAIGVVAGMVFIMAGIGGDRFFSKIADDFEFAYYPGALSLKNGDGYRNVTGKPHTHHPPGFSLLIAPIVTNDIDQSVQRIRWLAAVFGALNVALLAGIIYIVVPTVSIWILLPLIALWPPILPILSPGGSEFFFVVLLNSAIFLLVKCLSRPPDIRNFLIVSLVTGLLLGAATLTRVIGITATAAIFIAIVIGCRQWPKSWRVTTATSIVLVVCVSLLPWMKYVESHAGNFALSSGAEFSIQDGFAKIRKSTGPVGIPRFPQLVAGQVFAEAELWENANRQLDAIATVAKQYPASTVALMALKLIRPWYGTDSGRHMGKLMLVNLPWMILFALACIRSVVIWPRLPVSVVILVGVVTASWFAAILVISIFRYLAPVFPLAVIVIAWHGNDLYKIRSEKHKTVEKI